MSESKHSIDIQFPFLACLKVLYTRLLFIKNSYLKLHLLKLICPDTSKTKEIDYIQWTDACLNLSTIQMQMKPRLPIFQ